MSIPTESSSGRRWRHRLLRVGQALLRRTARLPLRRQLALGRALGSLLWLPARRYLHIARKNLELCFPELDPARRELLLRCHVQALGMGIFETAACWWSPDEVLRADYRIQGREHLDRALARDKGVLLLGAHFTTQELCIALLAYDYDMCMVYRRHHDPVQEELVRRARERHAREMIASSDMRRALKHLRAGHIVWYPPDQDFAEYGLEHNVFVPFFGIDAATVTVPGRLARSTGAALVPFFFRREADGGYTLDVQAPLDEVAGDPAAVARCYNAMLEAYIREVPEQYLWVHQRFKTRPDAGEPSPYLRT